MANGRKISDNNVAESLQGGELIPFAYNGGNANTTPDKIKEYVNDGLDDKYVAQEDGKGLSSNDFSDTDKSKLDGIEDGAQVNTVDSVNGRTGAVTGLAEASDIPTKVSELENDSKYQSQSDVSAAIEVGIAAHKIEVEQRLSTIEDDIEGLETSKVDKVNGKGLSSNDYTDDDKDKVDNLPENTNMSLASIRTDVTAIQNVGLPSKADKATTYTKTEVDTELAKKADKTSIPTKVSQLTNDSKYQTETQVNTALANKVDKVNGKQLSTEDFTTLLKQKLERLAIDVPDIDTRLTTLQTTLDTLIDDGGIDAVINSFIEVQNFLAGITNQQTLAGMLLDLRNDIVALCADTYLPLSGGTMTGPIKMGNGQRVSFFNDTSQIGDVGANDTYGAWLEYGNKYINIKEDGVYWNNTHKLLHSGLGTSSQFLKADGSVDSTAYLPKSGGTIKNGASNAPLIIDTDGNESALKYKINGIYKGLSGYDVKIGAYIYNVICNKSINITDDGIPQFAGNNIWHAGNDGSGSGLDADLLDGKQPADLNVGSADKLTTKQLTNEDLNDIKDTNFTSYYAGGGNTCLNKPGSADSFGMLSFRIATGFFRQIFCYARVTYYRDFNPNNNTWSEWLQLATTNGEVAKLTTKQLTNEDLNSFVESGTLFSALSGNTCANKPTAIGTNGFVLQVFKSTNKYALQILSSTGVVFKRRQNAGVWQPWKRMLDEDDIAPLIARIEALEARPTIASVASLPSSPNNNTLYAIPE